MVCLTFMASSETGASALTTQPEGQYSIRVAAIRSGVAAHTLRAWERRYGFPRPQRTSGGARRYSEADVETLRLIARALDSGFRPGEVVGQSRQRLLALLEPASSPTVNQARDAGPRPEPDETLVAHTLALARCDDLEAVRHSMQRAVVLLGPKRFVVQYAAPLAVALGEAWRDGTLSIQQEHLTSDALRTRLRVLLAGYEAPTDGPRVLLATLPDERHTLALDMVALYINLSGGRASSLGTPAPVVEIAQAARRLQVDAVGVSVSRSYASELAVPRLVEMRSLLPPTVALWLGGSGAAALGPVAAGIESLADWSDLDRALHARVSSSGG